MIKDIKARYAGSTLGFLWTFLMRNCPDSSFIAPYTGLSGSNTYTFETTGYLNPEETGYGIRAVVKVGGDKGFKYLYYKSPVDIRHDRYDKN